MCSPRRCVQGKKSLRVLLAAARRGNVGAWGLVIKQCYSPLLFQIAETTDLLHQPIDLDRMKIPTSSLRFAWGRSAVNSCTVSLTKGAMTAMVTTRQTSTIPYHKSTRILTSNCPFMDSGLITPGYVFSDNRQAGRGGASVGVWRHGPPAPHDSTFKNCSDECIGSRFKKFPEFADMIYRNCYCE